MTTRNNASTASSVSMNEGIDSSTVSASKAPHTYFKASTMIESEDSSTSGKDVVKALMQSQLLKEQLLEQKKKQHAELAQIEKKKTDAQIVIHEAGKVSVHM